MVGNFILHQVSIIQTFCSTHGFRYSYILSISFPNKHIINEMPMFGSGVHPSDFVGEWKLENRICYVQAVLCTKGQQKKSIRICTPNTVSSNHPRPVSVIAPNSGIKVA